MKNKRNCGSQDVSINDITSKEMISGIEKTVESALNISPEVERIDSITPKEGFKMKIELICADKDMSTQEKISAINEAEDKHIQDFAQNAETCKGVMWTKALLILTCTAGVVLMVSSPEGRKIATGIIKAIA